MDEDLTLSARDESHEYLLEATPDGLVIGARPSTQPTQYEQRTVPWSDVSVGTVSRAQREGGDGTSALEISVQEESVGQSLPEYPRAEYESQADGDEGRERLRSFRQWALDHGARPRQ